MPIGYFKTNNVALTINETQNVWITSYFALWPYNMLAPAGGRMLSYWSMRSMLAWDGFCLCQQCNEHVHFLLDAIPAGESWRLFGGLLRH